MMLTLSSVCRNFSIKQTIKRTNFYLGAPFTRCYTKNDGKNSKSIAVQGNKTEECVRVRRARPADVPRILRFVRQNSRASWPGLCSPAASCPIVLSDYVSRALSQGHTLVAEQQESRKGWTQILGLALGMSVCPWDAMMLEKWAQCISCSQTRRIINLSAHCLRAPALHDKYRVHNILQIILMVPKESPRIPELASVLAKNAIQRGKEVGFSVLRFDVTDAIVSNTLEELKLKKEWQLNHGVLPEPLKDIASSGGPPSESYVQKKLRDRHNRYMTVYSAFPRETQ